MKSVAMAMFGAAVALPAFVNIDFVLGFTDYVLNDQHDLQMCVFGVLLPISDGLEVYGDINKTVHDKNFTEFVQAMDDLNSTVTDLKHALKTCAPIKPEAQVIAETLENISSVQDLIHHVEANVVSDDKQLIVSSLKEAVVAYNGGNNTDWAAVGQHFGTAFRSMLIAPYPKHQLKSSGLPSFVDIDFVLNFLDYMLEDTNDVEMCVSGVLTPVSDVLDGVDHLNKSFHKRNVTEFKIVMADVHQLINVDLPSALQTCHVVSADAQAVLEVLSGIKSPVELVKLMAEHWKNDPTGLIPSELEAVFQAAAHQPDPDTAAMGQHFGALIHRLIVNTTYPDEKTIIV